MPIQVNTLQNDITNNPAAAEEWTVDEIAAYLVEKTGASEDDALSVASSIVESFSGQNVSDLSEDNPDAAEAEEGETAEEEGAEGAEGDITISSDDLFSALEIVAKTAGDEGALEDTDIIDFAKEANLQGDEAGEDEVIINDAFAAIIPADPLLSRTGTATAIPTGTATTGSSTLGTTTAGYTALPTVSASTETGDDQQEDGESDGNAEEEPTGGAAEEA